MIPDWYIIGGLATMALIVLSISLNKARGITDIITPLARRPNRSVIMGMICMVLWPLYWMAVMIGIYKGFKQRKNKL